MAEETLIINLKIDATKSAKTIAELTKRNRELAKVIKNAPREGQEGFEELNKELKKAKTEFAKNREEILKFNRDLRETKVASDSLKGLSRKLRDLEKEYKSLGKESREAIGGQKLKNQIKSTRNQLKKLESEIGDSRRNVGNYGKAWKGAGNNIAKLGRTAQKTLSAVRFLAVGAFSSLVDGAFAAAEAINKLAAFLSSSVALQNRMAEASSEAAGKFIEEKTELEGLLTAADANNESTKEAVAARNILLDQYGDILSAEAKEALLVGETTLARKEATKELIKNIAVEGQRAQLKKIFEELAQAEVEAANLARKAESEFGKSTQGVIDFSLRAIQGITGTSKKATLDVVELQKVANEQRKKNLIEQAKDIDKVGAALESTLTEINGVIEKTLGTEVGKASNKSAKSIEDFSKRSSSASSVLSGSLSSLRSQLSSINKEINETVKAGDAEALVPLIEQAKGLEEQIGAAENIIKDLRGELAETEEEQEKRLKRQNQILIELTLNAEQQATLRAEARRNERNKEINETIKDEEIKNKALEDSEKLFQNQKAEIQRTAREKELKESIDLVNEVTDETLQKTILRLFEERNLKLSAEKLTAEERLQIEKEFNSAVLEAQLQAEKERLLTVQTGSEEEIAIKQKILDLELNILNEKNKEEERLSKERIDKTKEEENKKLELKKASEKAAFDVAKTFSGLAFDLANKKAEETKNAELEAVRKEFAEKLQLAAGNAAEEERLKEQQARKEAEIEKKAAQTKKALAIGQAVINGALAALQTLANLGLPLAVPALVAVAATTAANIAVIASQKLEKGGIAKKKKKFDGGGLAPGRLHRDGGTPAIIGGTEAVEIEVGEAITNRKSTARFLQTLSDINQSEGGIRFEGTKPLTKERLKKLTAFEMLSSQFPTFARRGLSPRLSSSVRRSFQTGGVSSIQNAAESVKFEGKILSEADIKAIASAAAAGTKKGIEEANLFLQFRRQAEREINQNDRSKV